jgi:hypothetical protein
LKAVFRARQIVSTDTIHSCHPHVLNILTSLPQSPGLSGQAGESRQANAEHSNSGGFEQNLRLVTSLDLGLFTPTNRTRARPVLKALCYGQRYRRVGRSGQRLAPHKCPHQPAITPQHSSKFLPARPIGNRLARPIVHRIFVLSGTVTVYNRLIKLRDSAPSNSAKNRILRILLTRARANASTGVRHRTHFVGLYAMGLRLL